MLLRKRTQAAHIGKIGPVAERVSPNIALGVPQYAGTVTLRGLLRRRLVRVRRWGRDRVVDATVECVRRDLGNENRG